MGDKDPFSGIRLSEQTSSPKLDQRLFSSDEAKLPPATKVEGPVKSEPAAEKKPPESPAPAKTITRVPVLPTQLTPASLATSRFDLNNEALYKATFVFTREELEALEDLKLELSRQLDTKVTKYDLIRSGLHMLVEDYRSNGQRSYITRKIRRR